jgi:hypothetical protein
VLRSRRGKLSALSFGQTRQQMTLVGLSYYQPMPISSDVLLTVDEVAERLRVNQQTVRNWI